MKHEGAHSVRPKIIEQPKSKYGYLKGNFTLSCTATSSVDDPILIEWLHKDEKLVDAAATTINNKQQVIGSNLYRRSSLFIQRNIQFESEGGYRCVVRNKYGSDWSNIANMTVIGKYFDYVTSLEQIRIFFFRESSTSLYMHVSFFV